MFTKMRKHRFCKWEFSDSTSLLGAPLKIWGGLVSVEADLWLALSSVYTAPHTHTHFGVSGNWIIILDNKLRIVGTIHIKTMARIYQVQFVHLVICHFQNPFGFVGLWELSNFSKLKPFCGVKYSCSNPTIWKYCPLFYDAKSFKPS